MIDQEKGLLMPENISLKRNNETRNLINNIKKLERYYYFTQKETVQIKIIALNI